MILRICLENFRCFERIDLRFDGAPGLCGVYGENRIADYANSNGTGKSTIQKGLSWIYFGEWSGMSSVKAILRRSAPAGTAAVGIVEQQINGKLLCVKRRRLKSGETVTVKYGDDVEKSWDSSAANAYIASILGIDFVRYTKLLSYNGKFALAAQTDSELKSLLCALMPLDVTPANAALSKMLQQVRAQHTGASQRVIDLQRRLESALQKAAEERSKEAAWDVERATNVARLRAAAEQAAANFAYAAQVATAWQEHVRRITQGSDLETARARARALLTHIPVERDRVQELAQRCHDLELYMAMDRSGTACPTCKQPWPDVNGQRSAALEADMFKRRGEFDTAQSNWKSACAELDALQREEKAVYAFIESQTAAPAREAESTLQQAKSALENAQSVHAGAQTQLAVAEKLENPYARSVRVCTESIDALHAEIETCTASITSAASQIARLQYVVSLTDKRGLQHFLLETIIPELSARAAVNMTALSAGDMRVKFAMVTESGQEKMHIAAESRTGGDTYAELSDGERQRVDISVFLAVCDLARESMLDCGVLFLDEMLDAHTDRTAKLSMLELLNAYAIRANQRIFVITNDTAIMEDRRMFTSCLRVVADQNGSRIEEVTA